MSTRRRFGELPIADRVIFLLAPFLMLGGYLGVGWLRGWGLWAPILALVLVLALFGWMYFRWWRRGAQSETKSQEPLSPASPDRPEAEVPRHREPGPVRAKFVPPARPWLVAPVIAIGLSLVVLVSIVLLSLQSP